MCGRDLTKTMTISFTIMGGLKFNKRYQIARTWGNSMFVGVNPILFISSSSSHIWYTKTFIHFLSFFKKALQSSLCLNYMSLFEFLFALFLLLFSLNNCVWVSFLHPPSCILVARVFVVFPSSHFLMFSKFMFLLFFLIAFLLLQACVCVVPSLCSCWFSWSCSCYSKLETLFEPFHVTFGF
jgi:hypothetical protein